MHNCPKCGTENDDEMVVCINCDTILISGTDLGKAGESGKTVIGSIKVGRK